MDIREQWDGKERRINPDERYRSGWCCDYDFETGQYRTGDCISRTRNADVVERQAFEAGVCSATGRETKSNLKPHSYQEHPLYPNYCKFAGDGEDYCKREPEHSIHKGVDFYAATGSNGGAERETTTVSVLSGYEAAIREVNECDKCDLCEDHVPVLPSPVAKAEEPQGTCSICGGPAPRGACCGGYSCVGKSKPDAATDKSGGGELLPCPFCLGSAFLTSVQGGDEGDGYVWTVGCAEDNDCCVQPQIHTNSEHSAIHRWNYRRAPSPLDEAVQAVAREIVETQTVWRDGSRVNEVAAIIREAFAIFYSYSRTNRTRDSRNS